MDKREKKGLAIGAVFGAVFGVIAGILFAPKSGKETRKDIKEATVKATDKILEEAHSLQTDAKDLVVKAEKQISTLKGRASEQAKMHVDDLKHTASQMSNVVKSFKAGESSDKDLQNAIKQAKQAHDSLKKYLKK